jgi:high-affinity iron transporter
MIPTFVIFLREGVEASMIVAILLSYLDQIGQRRHFRDIFLGVGAALVLVLGGGIAAYSLIHQYEGSTVQTIFETITFLLAATVLTYMTFWMQKHSRTMRDELQRRSEEALEGRTRWGLGLLAFQAVGREGLETMVFTLAIVFASSSQAPTTSHGHGLLFGALLGLALALAIAYVIFKLGRRLNLGIFFRVIGIVLMVFAAGLLADAVENMQQLGWLPFLDHVMWNTSTYLSEDSSIGDVFHSLLGYADQPTVLQFIVWAVYLIVATTAFILLGRKKQGGARKATAAGAAVPVVADVRVVEAEATTPQPATAAGAAAPPGAVPHPQPQA